MSLLGTLAVVEPTRSLAADAKPAKKDSRPGARPKEATFTTSVSPAEARPGDTVTYSVTAKIDAPWHIYKYSKTPVDNGPKYTEFDFFDTDGLKIDGDWTPSVAPIKKKEPAFPDIPFLEYHEDEVTWSLKLKVPADAKPGKKTLKCQAGYMICSDSNCSFPGQWTLPEAELTITSAPKRLAILSQSLGSSLVGFVQLPIAGGLEPKEEDSPKVLRPKSAIEYQTEIVPKQAKRGETVVLKVSGKVAAPWHIYKYSKTQPDDGGPLFTTFDLFDTGGLVPKGDWEPARPPIRHKDPNYPKLEALEYYEGDFSWSIPLEVPRDAKPGNRSIRAQIHFMVCTDQNCSPPLFWTMPAAAVEILEGEATPKASETKPIATWTSAPAGTPEPREIKNSVETGKPSAVEVGGLANQGLISFLLACAAGGLFALAMPCIWPMIPVTVNFFVKQGQKKQGSTTGLAIAYCLSIIGTFMAIGILCSVFFGATSLSELANYPWLNLAIAGAFLVFGLSLLGLFEIRLPNFLLNASAQGEGKGGMIGVMFMALTLTITSFTCTFPVVGSLLVIASKGSYFYPVIGLATFAGVVALPFFLLALSPGLLSKMPKSGDWMNTVKVVGGLIEIAAAFKFINAAESIYVLPEDAWFNAYTVLSIWIVMLLICGVYLLGLFRTDHDYEEAKVGPGRLVIGWAFLSLALFLMPALFGRPPESKIWYVVAGLLPNGVSDLKAPVATSGEKSQAKSATSTDPKQAEREQTTVHGVAWGMSFEAAQERAKAENKPILIDFTGVNCPNCRIMELEVFPKSEVVQAFGNFVTVQLYTDSVPIKSLSASERKTLARSNLEREFKFFDEVTNPNYVILDADGNILGKLGGKVSAQEFVGFLKSSLGKFKGASKVAQGG